VKEAASFAGTTPLMVPDSLLQIRNNGLPSADPGAVAEAKAAACAAHAAGGARREACRVRMQLGVGIGQRRPSTRGDYAPRLDRLGRQTVDGGAT